MSEARPKLGEAIYFLARMRETAGRAEEFVYNLSAFVSAARSVTLFIQREFKHHAGFDAWYASKQEVMARDPEMTLLNAQRVLTIHKKNLQPRQSVIIDVPGTVRVRVGEHGPAIHIVDEDGNDLPVEASGIGTAQVVVKPTIHIKYQFDAMPDRDVLSICGEYIAKLATLLNECESRFSA